MDKLIAGLRVLGEAWFVLVAVPLVLGTLFFGGCASQRQRENAYWGKVTPHVAATVNGTSR